MFTPKFPPVTTFSKEFLQSKFPRHKMMRNKKPKRLVKNTNQIRQVYTLLTNIFHPKNLLPQLLKIERTLKHVLPQLRKHD